MPRLWNTLPSLLLLAAQQQQSWAYTWPDPKIDNLESLLFEQVGYHASASAADVSFCFQGFAQADGIVTGRVNSAEWLRTAYHDMATADVEAGTGGIDASIMYELDRPENIGGAFNGTMSQMKGQFSSRSSMSDLIAMAARFAVQSCSNGNITIPFRGGRVDATEAGPAGVPQPQQSLEEHTSTFAKQGFNQTEMIALVACGHTLGGVHGSNFPEIVTPEDDPDNITSLQQFDGTVDFDNTVATGFVQNSTQNALAFGHNETTNSDHRIFMSDGGDMIRRLAEDNAFFEETCKPLLERMLNTVPKEVELSDAIEAIPIKPDNLEVIVTENSTMFISGEIRTLRDTYTDPSTRQVNIHLLHKGSPLSSSSDDPIIVPTTTLGLVQGFWPNTPTFDWWGFNVTIPQIITSDLSFVVETIDEENSITHDNNGSGGYPLQTSILPLRSESCGTPLGAGSGREDTNRVEITAAVLSSETAEEGGEIESVWLSVDVPVPQEGIMSPRLEVKVGEMEFTGEKLGSGGEYSLYKGSVEYGSNGGIVARYDVFGKGKDGEEIVMSSSGFHSQLDLPACS